MFNVKTRSTRRIYRSVHGRKTLGALSDPVGVAAAVTGAFAYGITVVIGRHLAQAGFGPALGLGIRFGIAAVVMLVILGASRRPLLPASGERVRALGLGAFGYAVEATFFYLGLARGSAAAVSLLFYTYPALVAVLEIPLIRRLPRRGVVAGLALAVAGTAVLTVSGQQLDITSAGIAFSLASAVSVALYIVAAERLLQRTDALTSGAWVALGASLALFGGAAAARHLHVPPGHRLELTGYGLSTAVAFTMLFVSLRRLGPSRTAVVMTLEAFFAAVLAAVFLSERLTWLHAVGGGAILAGALCAALTPAVADAPAGP